ncbi:hypothetical protein SARI_01035 [Salmonella enterica subsp. arizonae serovar 62:z4,z23:-]|uniref:Uncharacterized protein n=1 Tax=Salmonella arizonae (strain ATCC BAA-731 / CDC346-86 / RSK2980) TaxID=41514 RepID=A9MNC0_SALAR|nr:hypothetical protein SARI_01035 [Salmonella enterica subsp. arizonae serovar 62:z4,z23:-]
MYLPDPKEKWQKHKESANARHRFIKHRFYLLKRQSQKCGPGSNFLLPGEKMRD